MRPRRLVVVAGTGTEIGKTWVAASLAAALRGDGWDVSARKPAQSGDPGDDVSDADVLAAATGEEPAVVCPPHRRYSIPMAPPMAAESLGLEPPTLGELSSEVEGSWPAKAVDVGLVELAGGVASPAAIDGDGADLAARLAPDGLVLVADAGLGTINAVRLSCSRLARAPVVFLNRYDDDDELHRRNREWLAVRDGFAVVTSIDELASWALGLAPGFCPSCGRPDTECDGSCRRQLDPDRYCTRCGRRLVVSISPTGHSSRCKTHGAVT